MTNPTRAGAASRPTAVLSTPVTAGGLLLLVGGLGLVTHQPWLFPSLGPTAYMQATHPNDRVSSFYNVVVGHVVGLFAGYASVLAFAAAKAPVVLGSGQITPARVGAAVLALALTVLFGKLLDAVHPPAASTTLLVALGGLSFTLRDALTVVAAVLILAVAGSALHGLRRSGRSLA